jgi:glutathione S-transferase
MPSYKVVYFDGRGRAELSRLILTASGTPFEDVRVKDWPNGLNFFFRIYI